MANIKPVRPYGEFDRALNKHFGTRREKKEYLKKHGLRHDGSTESERHRIERIAEQYNEQRKKEGKKPRTVQEIVGTTRRIPQKLYFFT